jgi:TetR/AcrR family transcriptional repressor of nem operon
MAAQDDNVARYALAGFERLEEIYRHCIEEAQASGEVHQSANAGALAAYFVAITRGMEVLGSAGVGRVRLTGIAVTSMTALPVTAPRTP